MKFLIFVSLFLLPNLVFSAPAKNSVTIKCLTEGRYEDGGEYYITDGIHAPDIIYSCTGGSLCYYNNVTCMVSDEDSSGTEPRIGYNANGNGQVFNVPAIIVSAACKKVKGACPNINECLKEKVSDAELKRAINNNVNSPSRGTR